MMKQAFTKIMTLVFCLTMTLLISVTSAWSLLSDNDTDAVSGAAGDVAVDLEENFVPGGPTGSNTTTKEFWGIARGNKRCYIRAKIVPSFEYQDEAGNWQPFALPVGSYTYVISAATTTPSAGGYWIFGGGVYGDYYYFSKILNPNGQTTVFTITDVQWKDGKVPAVAAGKVIRYKLDVVMEASQATHETYKQNWGIPSLPTGVELLP